MDNPTTAQEGPPKKGPLDNLSREELIKKCKGLLSLAQKAKQAKDEHAEENKNLKEMLNKYETQKDADKKSLVAMKEIVDALTENKLTLTTQLADHKAQCDRLQSQLQNVDQISIENEALKRQLKRLSDENEELLGDLDAMEKKLEQVNKFGIQQQKDLVLLEKETSKWKKLEETVEQLQNELIRKTFENDQIETMCKDLEKQVSQHQQNQTDLTQKLGEHEVVRKKCEALENEITHYRKNVTEVEVLQSRCKELEALVFKYEQSQSELNEKIGVNNKLIKKCRELEEELEKHRDVHKKFELKSEECENLLTKYTELEKNISDCKHLKMGFDQQTVEMEKLKKINNELVEENQRLNNCQNELVQKTEENDVLQRKYKDLEKDLVSLQELHDRLSQKNQEIEFLNRKCVCLEEEIVSIKQCQNEIYLSKEEIENLRMKCRTLEEEISKQKQSEDSPNAPDIENYKTLIENLQAEKVELGVKLKGLEHKIEHIESYGKTIEVQAIEIDQLQKMNEKYVAKLQLFKSKIVEFSSKLKKLKKSREILIETVQEYAHSVPKWQKEIFNASNQISHQLMVVEVERKRLEEEVLHLKVQLQILKKDDSPEPTVICMNKIQEIEDYCERARVEYEQKVDELRMKCTETEDLRLQVFELSESLSRCQIESEDKSKDILGLQSDIAALTKKLNNTLASSAEAAPANYQDELKQGLQALEINYANKLEELDTTRRNLEDINTKYSKAIEESKEKDNEIRQIKEEVNLQQITIEELRRDHENARKSLDESNEVADKTIKSLQDEITSKSSQLKNLEQEKNNLLTSLKEKTLKLEQLSSSLSLRETENSDMLAEMRELNEAFKGRGDVISRQQDKIKELEAEIRKTSEKLLKIESNLSDKDNTIIEKELQITSMNKEIVSTKGEVDMLLEKAKQNEIRIKTLSEEVSSMRERQTDCQSDAISTSTISRVEEVSRLREVDESLEEKYNKLRALAIKLKKKVHEQAAHIATLETENRSTSEEKNEVIGKLKVKNLQALQNENDKLLDEVEKLKTENRKYEKQIKSLETDIAGIKNTATSGKTSSSNLDRAVKEYQNQIKFLKQEVESVNLIRREIEKERDSLKIEATKKSEEIAALKIQCDKLKAEIERKKTAEKKSNVLNLEIDAYEKSLNDVTQKLEKSKNTVKDLKGDIETKEATIKSLNAQIKLLEESIDSEKNHSLELKQQIDIQHAKSKECEHEKLELRLQLQDRNKECENFKSQIDELQLQVSTIASDKDKLCTSLQTEKDKLIRHVYTLEESIEESKNKLKTTEHELEDLRAEYVSYKIKAQSVLRQNQSKESSRERDLEEDLNICRKEIESLAAKLKSTAETLDGNEKKIEDLRHDNERIQKRCKELIQALEESRVQNEQLLDDNRKQNDEHQEALKSHRLQIETLNNCYKSQIEDLEKKHQIQLDELRSRDAQNNNKPASRIGPFGGATKPTNDEQKIDLILMEREDAEGSETASSHGTKHKTSTSKTRRDFIPLDELLNSTMDEIQNEHFRSISPTLELQQTKEKLHVQESRVKHLTALLAENEQDLAKLTQLNDLLKEEVRRQERSLEREPHIQNSEYLKNVIFKFVTLNSGDERTRLVPVLDTILKLSPEEKNRLQNVARGGDNSNRSWGSYLPVWSNHQ